MQTRLSAAGPGLSAAILHEIADCLTLALDATEKRHGYSQPEREARSYIRAALRDTRDLLHRA